MNDKSITTGATQRWIFVALFWLLAPVALADPAVLIQQVADYPHTLEVESSETAVIDHAVGLGALQKVRGAWRFKSSERLTGTLSRYTWQVVDGFTSEEVFEQVARAVDEQPGAQSLFECVGLSCGHGSQWANRVFQQRILYGRNAAQRYRVYSLGEEGQYRLLIYGAVRTADRQYLHLELLAINPD